MNISGIRPVDGFYDYNRIMSLQVMPVREVEANNAIQVLPTKEATVDEVSEEEINQAKAKQTFGAYDFANQYDPSATYSLKGEKSELKNLDVEKAISDMQKDQAIHQYQYFVGNKNKEAEVIMQMENFAL